MFGLSLGWLVCQGLSGFVGLGDWNFYFGTLCCYLAAALWAAGLTWPPAPVPLGLLNLPLVNLPLVNLPLTSPPHIPAGALTKEEAMFMLTCIWSSAESGALPGQLFGQTAKLIRLMRSVVPDFDPDAMLERIKHKLVALAVVEEMGPRDEPLTNAVKAGPWW